MAKFDYEELKAGAVELIEEFGQRMTIEKPDGSEKQSFTGVLLGLSSKDGHATLATSATAKVLTSGVLKREIDDNGDIVTIKKIKYVVVQTDALRPGGTDVLYTIWLRS